MPGGNWEERSASVATLLTSSYQPLQPVEECDAGGVDVAFAENGWLMTGVEF